MKMGNKLCAGIIIYKLVISENHIFSVIGRLRGITLIEPVPRVAQLLIC